MARGGLIGGGLPIPRPDLHFFYNLIQTVPLVIGLAWQLHRAYDEQRPGGRTMNYSSSESRALARRRVWRNGNKMKRPLIVGIVLAFLSSSAPSVLTQPGSSTIYKEELVQLLARTNLFLDHAS